MMEVKRAVFGSAIRHGNCSTVLTPLLGGLEFVFWLMGIKFLIILGQTRFFIKIRVSWNTEGHFKTSSSNASIILELLLDFDKN